jgi:hypothetical protein
VNDGVLPKLLDVRKFVAESLSDAYDDDTATWVSTQEIKGIEAVMLEVSPDVGPTRHFRVTIEEVTLTDVE